MRTRARLPEQGTDELPTRRVLDKTYPVLEAWQAHRRRVESREFAFADTRRTRCRDGDTDERMITRPERMIAKRIRAKAIQMRGDAEHSMRANRRGSARCTLPVRLRLAANPPRSVRVRSA